MDVKIFSRSPEPFFLLAEDVGAIGQILRGFAKAAFGEDGHEFLCEAARREVDGDDPWKFLLEVRGILPQYMKVFRAAQSQRVGWRRPLDKAHGSGRLREKCEQLATAPPGTPIQPCQQQLFARMWRVKRWVLLDDPKLNPEMRAEIERLGKEEDKKLLKGAGVQRLSSHQHIVLLGKIDWISPTRCDWSCRHSRGPIAPRPGAKSPSRSPERMRTNRRKPDVKHT